MCLLRVLVLQLPVVQGLLYMVLLVMWAEEESLYEVNYMYLQPVVVVSILTGIWGLLMTIKMLSTVLSGHLVLGKFVALQAVLLLAKFQGLAARALAWYNVLPCNPPLTPAVYANRECTSCCGSQRVSGAARADRALRRPALCCSHVQHGHAGGDAAAGAVCEGALLQGHTGPHRPPERVAALAGVRHRGGWAEGRADGFPVQQQQLQQGQQ